MNVSSFLLTVNQNLKVPWIKSNSSNAKEIIELLKGFLKKKRKWNLDGSSEEYDFFHGCYGNPNSKTVFLAEIPSFSGLEIANRLYMHDERWKSAWKISTGDLIYRSCLNDYALIPDPLSDSPSNWDCWLTDFVKCAHSDKTWKALKKSEKERILLESARILQKELRIIKPENLIIVGKSETLSLFEKHMKSWKDGNESIWKDKNGEPKWIYHYAREKSIDPESRFVERFNYVMKQIGRLRKVP